ncbi:MAG: nucleoside triphosphate pyrophosphohydrolase [Anaerolineae bacterium]
MSHITIVGLGPGSAGDLTREAWQVLESAGEVWLRTLHHPVVADLPPHTTVRAFDEIYEQAETFAAVYAEIAQQVLELGRREAGVVYAVPGHPLVGEATVTQILATSEHSGVPVRIVDGLSFVEPSLTALGIDALEGLQVFDALDLLPLYHPPLNPDLPVLIAQVYSRAVASQLKLVLMNQYDDEHPTVLIDGAGTSRERLRRLPLYQIDREETTPLTTLYVAPLPAVTSFEGFQETIARLRSPDGCPWDREQTHQTLRTNLLEEAYEVLEAIDLDDANALREELGDLLLQIVLHAQIAVETGEFHMTEVIAQIDAKLKRRHPHVWGGLDVADVGEVITNWEAIKRRERVDEGAAERSLLDGIPKALPALAQAVSYVDRAARIGFDQIEADGVWVNLPKRLAKLVDAWEAELDAVTGVETEQGQEWFGDALLVLVDWARRQSIDPESTLRQANQCFANRFRIVEAAAQQQGIALEDLTLDEIKRLWRDRDMA